jgi:ubiquinone/menaquinone biosynthesis C-methylase UbiE
MDDALYHDPDLARFYDWDNPWTVDFDWFQSLIEGAGSVLDLGCGTGIFTAALAARGLTAVGVDPAAAMLQIARSRVGGDKVRWVQGAAQGLNLGQRFGAVVMTGHAFQNLLTAKDRATVLATIARHLEPGGRFFFDSRNPEARAWERWTREATRQVRQHPDFGMVERWINASWDEESGIVSYVTRYEMPDGRQLQARSQIAFPSFAELAEALTKAGLRADRWAGDAAGGPLRPGCPDFIPVGGLAT